MEKEKLKVKRVTSATIAAVVLISVFTALSIAPPAVAAGTSYDLTTDPTGLDEVTINGAIWALFTPTDPTGSGVFHAFFREQASPNERGYNTDYRPLQFDELKSATFTRSVLLTTVPIVEYNGIFYREFQLDINEEKSSPEWYISLDEFQVWTTDNQYLTGYDEGLADGSGDGYFPIGAELVYDLDDAGDSWIMMDFRANPGSGKRDYKVLVPQNYFVGKELTYCVIFARHGLEGGDWISGDGYEEWGVAVYPTEPAICVEKLVDCNDDGVFLKEDMGYAGDTGNWSIVVINCGSAHFTAVTVTDTNGMSWGPFPLAVGESKEFNYDTTVNVDTNNTVTVTATDAEDRTVTATDWAINYVVSPDICVVKTVDCNNDSVFLKEDMGYAGDTAHWKVNVSNCGDSNLTNVVVTDTNGNNFGAPFDLAVGESKEFNYDTTVNVDTKNTVNVTATDLLGGTVTATDWAINYVVSPHTTLTVVTYVYDTVLGNVEINISDCNDGDDPLTDPCLNLRANGVVYDGCMNDTAPEFVGGDDSGDGILDPGECWEWYVVVTISETTFFEAWGYGVDSLGNPVTYDPDTGEGMISEYKNFTVEVGNATRTQGFWATHLYVPPDGTMGFTEYVFNKYTGNPPDDNESTPGYIDLGWKLVESIEDLMGIFWANNAKESDGGKRDKLCQARIIASQQALAAILNSAMPGGAPLPADYSPSKIADILALENGYTIDDIKTLNTELTKYNEAGDSYALDPSLPPTYRADPKHAKEVANITFADC